MKVKHRATSISVDAFCISAGPKGRLGSYKGVGSSGIGGDGSRAERDIISGIGVGKEIGADALDGEGEFWWSGESSMASTSGG